MIDFWNFFFFNILITTVIRLNCTIPHNQMIIRNTNPNAVSLGAAWHIPSGISNQKSAFRNEEKIRGCTCRGSLNITTPGIENLPVVWFRLDKRKKESKKKTIENTRSTRMIWNYNSNLFLCFRYFAYNCTFQLKLFSADSQTTCWEHVLDIRGATIK